MIILCRLPILWSCGCDSFVDFGDFAYWIVSEQTGCFLSCSEKIENFCGVGNSGWACCSANGIRPDGGDCLCVNCNLA